MSETPLIVALPTADRQVAHAFYEAGLGFESIGELADDGVPEPLQFVLNEGVRLMFIPTGGFGWVTGDHETAAPGTSVVLAGHDPGEAGLRRQPGLRSHLVDDASGRAQLVVRIQPHRHRTPFGNAHGQMVPVPAGGCVQRRDLASRQSRKRSSRRV